MRQLRVSVLLLAVFAVSSLMVTPYAKADGFDHGIGIGIQYGGTIGWQGSYTSNKNKLKFALGPRGLAIGADRFIAPKVSLGLQGFANTYKYGTAINANYHFGDNSQSGWIVGLDVFYAKDSIDAAIDLLEFLFDFDRDPDDPIFDSKSKGGAFISIGYHF